MERTRVDQNGRILVPAPLRHRLGLRNGSELTVSVDEHDRLILESSDSAWRDVQGLFAKVRPGRSVVEELLQERRADAERET